MKALIHKHEGIAILFLVVILTIAGCQPVSQEQSTATGQPPANLQPTVTLAPTSTPRPTPTPQPTAVLQPTDIPTVAPEHIVIAEGEANCPIIDFEEEEPLTTVNDPELGNVDRAFVVRFSFTCPEPYLKGKNVAIQDGYTLEDGKYVWTSLQEAITDEGGAWKGTCESGEDRPSLCVYKGEGKYTGLQLSTEYDLSTFKIKFRVTRLIEKEEQLTAAPTLAPGETVVVEREANCPIMDFEEDEPVAIVNDPELGDVDRAFVIRFAFTCPEPYVKGKQVAIQDGYYLKDGTTYVWTSLQEAVTDEGGVWKGRCETGTDRPSRCIMTGDGKYQGLRYYSEYDLNTSILKLLITRPVE